MLAEECIDGGSTLEDAGYFPCEFARGRGDEMRLCLYTNYCEALDQQHRQVICELWDRERLDEPGITLSADGKRRLIAPAWRLSDCDPESWAHPDTNVP